MSLSPDSDLAHLEERLLKVLRAVHSDPAADLLVRRRVALTFLFSEPELAVRVDGRGGERAAVSTGDAARAAPSDLTFRMPGRVAHALWLGDLNPVSAVMAGQLALQGPLPLALALGPSLRVMQAAYRAVVAQEDALSTPGA